MAATPINKMGGAYRPPKPTRMLIFLWLLPIKK